MSISMEVYCCSARSVSPIKLVEESDPLYTWRARVFEQFHQDLTETIGYPV